MKRFLLGAAISYMALASLAQAGDCGCQPACGQCGCCVKPVCRIVCEMKDVKEWCYDCKCEDFCVPGKSTCVGYHPECDCCGCVKMKPTYKPCWCDMFCRKKLYKREIVKKVPHYKCVVEYVCVPACGCGCRHGHCHAQSQSAAAESLAQGQPDLEPTNEIQTEEFSPSSDKNLANSTAATKPVIVRAPSRLLPPPPLPEAQEKPFSVRQASHNGSSLRLKLKESITKTLLAVSSYEDSWPPVSHKPPNSAGRRRLLKG